MQCIPVPGNLLAEKVKRLHQNDGLLQQKPRITGRLLALLSLMFLEPQHRDNCPQWTSLGTSSAPSESMDVGKGIWVSALVDSEAQGPPWTPQVHPDAGPFQVPRARVHRWCVAPRLDVSGSAWCCGGAWRLGQIPPPPLPWQRR